LGEKARKPVRAFPVAMGSLGMRGRGGEKTIPMQAELI
jgi:hypothetical protein